MRLIADREALAAGEHHFDRLDVVAGRTDAHRMRTGRVQRHHAADRRDAGPRRVGREIPAVGPKASLSVRQTTPGCTRTVVAPIASICRMCREKSITSPGPSDSPARPVPAPRGMSGIRSCAAYCTRATTSSRWRGKTTPRGGIWYRLPSVEYIETVSGSQRISPCNTGVRSSMIRDRAIFHTWMKMSDEFMAENPPSAAIFQT